MEVALGIALVIGAVLGIAILVAWIVLPFTIVRKLNELIRQVEHTNAMIGSVQVPDRSPPPIPSDF